MKGQTSNTRLLYEKILRYEIQIIDGDQKDDLPLWEVHIKKKIEGLAFMFFSIGFHEEDVHAILGRQKTSTTIDVIAQQLKFIACLKIMMEELSTLATGFEVDGGLLRY